MISKRAMADMGREWVMLTISSLRYKVLRPARELEILQTVDSSNTHDITVWYATCQLWKGI
jgi:hypothetical protein